MFTRDLRSDLDGKLESRERWRSPRWFPKALFGTRFHRTGAAEWGLQFL